MSNFRQSNAIPQVGTSSRHGSSTVVGLLWRFVGLEVRRSDGTMAVHFRLGDDAITFVLSNQRRSLCQNCLAKLASLFALAPPASSRIVLAWAVMGSTEDNADQSS